MKSNNYKVHVISELIAVRKPFGKTIWARNEVDKYYNSAKEASKHHKLRNCNYDYVIESDSGLECYKVVRSYRNGKVDAYGTRYNGTL